MRSTLLILISFFYSFVGYGQGEELRKAYEQADYYLANEDFVSAAPIYKELLSKFPENADLQFKLGASYLYIPEYQNRALYHLKTSMDLFTNKGEIYIDNLEDISMQLGMAYQMNYMFDRAINIYNGLKFSVSEGYEHLLPELNRKLKECKNGIKQLQHVKGYTVRSLGPYVNSSFTDHSPIVLPNTNKLIFTTRSHQNSRSQKAEADGQYKEDVLYTLLDSIDRFTPQIFSAHINSSANEAACSVSPDGRYILFSRNGNIRRVEDIGGEWTLPQKASAPLNGMFSRETHALYAPDGVSMYFTSDRKSGLGGIDIFKVKAETDWHWGEVENLGANVNTIYDEETPFISPDGKFLFFSSKGHNTIGGYDVFKCELQEDGTWGKPINLGYPINTTANDVFYITSRDQKKVYYSSARYSSLGSLDLYEILDNSQYNYPKISGTLMGQEVGLLWGSKVRIKNMRNGATVGQAVVGYGDGSYSLMICPEVDPFLIFDYQEHFPKFASYKFDALAETTLLDKRLLPVKEGESYACYPQLMTDTSFSKREFLFQEALAEFMYTHPTMCLDISAGLSANNVVAAATKLITDMEITGSRIVYNHYMQGYKGDSIYFTLLDTISLKKIQELKARKLLAEMEAAKLKAAREKETALAELPIVKVPESPAQLAETKPALSSVTNGVAPRKVVVVQNIVFNLNEYKTNMYDQSLNRLADYLKRNPDAIIEVGGYTDTQGPSEYNKKLSEKRAEFAASYLKRKGVAQDQIQVKPYGEAVQIAKNKNVDGSYNMKGLTFNRRVEFRIIKQGRDLLAVKQIEVPEELKQEGGASDAALAFVYSIHLRSSKTQLPQNAFSGIAKVKETLGADGQYFYSYGSFSEVSVAEKEEQKIKELYPNAFVFILDESGAGKQ